MNFCFENTQKKKIQLSETNNLWNAGLSRVVQTCQGAELLTGGTYLQPLFLFSDSVCVFFFFYPLEIRQ